MSKLGSALKVGATVLAAVGGVATTAEIVTTKLEPQVNEYTQEIVERYNYEYRSEFNVEYTYWYNGEQIDAETYFTLMDDPTALISVEMNNKNQAVEILDEKALIIKYGALDELPTTLDELSELKYDKTPSSFTVNVQAGNEETDMEQWVVFAVPNTIEITDVRVSSFTLAEVPMENYSIGNYKVYYVANPSYDVCYGGFDYIVTLNVK